MEEIWKDIKGYEGLYQISNFGRVKSLNYRNTGKEQLLKPALNTTGYFCVMLCKPLKRFLIHRLVAKAFIPNPDNLPCVNHKDENPTNNHVDNLEWCTQLYNVNYGNGIIKRCKKVYQYTLDGELVKEWDSAMECSRNGFKREHIIYCCRGGFIRKGKWVNVTQHRGFKWSYEKKEDD